MISKLDYSIASKGSNQDKAFIMIHGWKGNKDSFKSIFNILNIPNCKWYAPEAPYIVDKEKGQKTWSYEKKPGVWEIEEPKKLLTSFIENEVFSEFDPSNTYVMGFSQGAAVCYQLISSLKYTLGGIFPVGGFIRNYSEQKDDYVEFSISPQQKNTPILIGHGKDDEVVPVEASMLAYKLLRKKCSNVDLDIYNGGHKINTSYLKKIKDFIVTR